MAITALRYPVFAPAMRQITAITNAFPAQVTTSFAHGYISGTIVRLYVPSSYGMYQVNKLYAPIGVNSPTTFYIFLNTIPFSPFVVPNPSLQIAQVVPIGEINSMLTAAVQNILPPLGGPVYP